MKAARNIKKGDFLCLSKRGNVCPANILNHGAIIGVASHDARRGQSVALPIVRDGAVIEYRIYHDSGSDRGKA